jgi:hypothetical protein
MTVTTCRHGIDLVEQTCDRCVECLDYYTRGSIDTVRKMRGARSDKGTIPARLTSREVDAAIEAIAFRLAGPIDEGENDGRTLESAKRKLGRMEDAMRCRRAAIEKARKP